MNRNWIRVSSSEGYAPIRITAHLESPCAPSGPLLLDGLLYFGVGRTMGREAGGWAGYDAPYQAALPLARVETRYGWWWAASEAVPIGGEAVAHTHRRTSPALLADRTADKAVNRSSGPDKSLRVPVFYRWRWLTIEWTAFGDPGGVGTLLAHLQAVGQRTTQGWGRVRRWEVRQDDTAPGAEDYARRVELRHLPVGLASIKELCAGKRLRYMRRIMPLRPPYWDRRDAVSCWQVVEPWRDRG